jgi:iron(III) transport system permease protein
LWRFFYVRNGASLLDRVRKGIALRRPSLGGIDWVSMGFIALSVALLSVFILIPVFSVVLEAFANPDGGLGVYNFATFWGIPSYRRGLWNSLVCASSTLLLTTLIGIPVAYVMTRYRFFGRRVFTLLTILPLMVPPFVGALAMIGMLGRNGLITNFIVWFFGEHFGFDVGLENGIVQPNIYSMILIQSAHLWPLIYLNTSASLSKIDPTLEESARNLGASRFTLFRRITLPLALPGYAAGALLVFIWSIADLGTPIMLNFGEYSVLQAFTELTVREGYREMAYVICIILTAISIAALYLVNRFIGLREYATFRFGAAPKMVVRRAGRALTAVVMVSLSLLVGLSIIPHLGTVLMAFSVRPPYGEWLPKGWTLEFMSMALSKSSTSVSVANSLYYSGLSALIDISLGAVIAYLLVRKSFPGKSVLDIVSMLPFAVPGIVIGLGYLHLFSKPIIGSFRLTSIWYILVVSYAMRRLPYSVRSSHAVLQQVHESLEEAAMNLGASKLKTFTRITIPLIMPGLIAGGILAFVSAFTEVSTSLLLQPIIGPFGIYAKPITLEILLQSRGGPTAMRVASSLGFIQIIATSVGLYLTNKLLGGKAGLAFGG